MNSDAKSFQTGLPIDAVRMKHDIQAKHHQETLGMNWDERMAYLHRKAAAFREGTRSTVLREEPARYGTSD